MLAAGIRLREEHKAMTEQPAKLTGGCLCGSVRYEAEVFLKNGYICRCTKCQRSTGQPAEITVPIKAAAITIC